MPSAHVISFYNVFTAGSIKQRKCLKVYTVYTCHMEDLPRQSDVRLKASILTKLANVSQARRFYDNIVRTFNLLKSASEQYNSCQLQ